MRTRFLCQVLACGLCAVAGCQAPSNRLALPEVELQPTWDLDQPRAEDLAQAGAGWAVAFADPRLTADLHTAIEEAPRILAAAHRLVAQVAGVDRTAAESLPELVAGATAGRLRQDRAWTSEYRASVALTWEVDLFGRLEAAVEEAEATADLAAVDLTALRLSQAAALAGAWLDAAHAREQIALLEDRAGVLDQEIRAWSALLADSGDALARVELIDRRTEAMELADELVVWRQHLVAADAAYAVVLGRATRSPAPVVHALPAPPALVSDLPTVVLVQRPDVARARVDFRRAVAAADVAWAERWPVLNLGASVGYQAAQLDRLITPQALVGEVVGGLVGPLFDGGRRRAAQAVAEAEAGAVGQTYRQVVAEAWQETRAALAAAMTSAVGDLSAAQHAANAEASADRVTADWHAGLVTTPDRYASRRLALEARILASTARHRAWRDWLTVQRALALPPMPMVTTTTFHHEVRP